MMVDFPFTAAAKPDAPKNVLTGRTNPTVSHHAFLERRRNAEGHSLKRASQIATPKPSSIKVSHDKLMVCNTLSSNRTRKQTVRAHKTVHARSRRLTAASSASVPWDSTLTIISRLTPAVTRGPGGATVADVRNRRDDRDRRVYGLVSR